ncbi:MAG: peptide deformylase [Victivallales bacterium]|nr:peptide deformylase [Victivallales bacterium]
MRKKIMPVYTYGAPVLKAIAAPVEKITPEIRELADRMIDTMFAFDGIGLAAPQVGVSKRIVALALPAQLPADYEPSPAEELLLPMMPMVIINPQIISYGKDKYISDEGCLSVPDIYAPVERPRTIVFQTEIIDYGIVTVEAGGLLARCIQHEMDHLNGTLFVEKVAPEAYTKIDARVRTLIARGAQNNYQRRK